MTPAETTVKTKGFRLPSAVRGDLSPSSVAIAFLAVLGLLLGVLLISLLREIALLFFLGLFIATVIDPGVRRMEHWGIPRSLAVLLHYAVFLGLAAFLLVSLVPIIAAQIAGLASLSTEEFGRFLEQPDVALPFIPEHVNRQLSLFLQVTLEQLSIQRLPDVLRQISSTLSTVAAGSLQVATGIAASTVRFLVDMVVVLLFTFFLEMERERAYHWLLQSLPPGWRPYAERKAGLIYVKLSQWAKGQLILCFVIGALVFILLLILRMPYALTLAILAGFTEFIPYAGPLLAAVPAVLIALSQWGFTWALITALCYYAVQWSENNIIVPLIMQKAVEISPVAAIFAMLTGVSFPSVIHPILGILLAIPVASILGIFLDDLRRQRNNEVTK